MRAPSSERRGFSYAPQTAGADSDHVYGGNVLGLVIAAICFLIILAALGWSIRKAIATVTDHQASDADVARVRSRLAAGGWALAKPEHFDPANWP